jgi:hypothetical protein
MMSSTLLRLALAGLAFSAIGGCSETAAAPQAATTAAKDADAAVAEMFSEKPASSRDRPDFTQETVLKLNPIVERSKKALDRFDELVPQLAAAKEAGDKPRIAAIIAEYGKLKAETDAAHVAFQAEKAALLKREEYYNEVILAAMEQFVAEAPGEIADALAAATK